MNEKLKSCPFCGSFQIDVLKTKGRWSVGCRTSDCVCNAWYVRQYNDRNMAVEKWNERAEVNT